ncbi:MAG TPA: hypothetical protein VMT20_17135 [Terriglobia bacterium]|nr:hypothetical protein [Terriglobia bacterium]
MKIRVTVLLSLAALAGWLCGGSLLRALAAPTGPRTVLDAPAAQGAAPKQPQWKSREEYDAFQALAKETDPHKKITLAEGVIQKYPTSDFKDAAYVQELTAYQQLGDSAKAMDAGKKALAANPDNLDALTYLSFAFPFVYNAKASDASDQLSQAEGYAKRGLDTLGKLQKPAQVSDTQFTEYVKAKRAIFNGTAGFVALQRKDYANAITSLKASLDDSPGDAVNNSLLGQAYYYSNPPDFNNAIWYLARSVSLGKAANSPNLAALTKFYDDVYTRRHGSNAGENDVLTQAASSLTPPADFKVAPAAKHAATGNAFVDAFYNYEDNLKAGGDTETSTWAQIKGQQFGGGGWVDNIDKAPDGSCLVHVDITNDSKSQSGTYDIELKDSQPGCKDLSQGDPLRFTGTISAYTTTPSFVLTLDNGNINSDDLAAAAADKKKPGTRPTHRRPGGH